MILLNLEIEMKQRPWPVWSPSWHALRPFILFTEQGGEGHPDQREAHKVSAFFIIMLGGYKKR